MRAIVRDRYGAAPYLADIPEPTPGAGEVLVRVVASSLNTADLEIMLGRPRVARIGSGFRRPNNRRLGLDAAGVVEAVGPGVTGLAIGDEVWGDVFGHFGAFAELVAAPAKAFSPKPTGVTFEDAACLPHSAAIALQALSAKGGVSSGDRVLISGAGGCVGPFAIQIAKARGAEVVAVDHGDKLDLMKRAGADHLVDYTTTDCTRLDDRFDFIVDIAANRNLLTYRRLLSERGRYVLVARDLSGFAAAVLLGGRRMGNFMWGPSKPSDLAELGRLLESGAITPIVDSVCTLDDVPAELRRSQAGATRGKVVVKTQS